MLTHSPSSIIRAYYKRTIFLLEWSTIKESITTILIFTLCIQSFRVYENEKCNINNCRRSKFIMNNEQSFALSIFERLYRHCGRASLSISIVQSLNTTLTSFPFDRHQQCSTPITPLICCLKRLMYDGLTSQTIINSLLNLQGSTQVFGDLSCLNVFIAKQIPKQSSAGIICLLIRRVLKSIQSKRRKRQEAHCLLACFYSRWYFPKQTSGIPAKIGKSQPQFSTDEKYKTPRLRLNLKGNKIKLIIISQYQYNLWQMSSQGYKNDILKLLAANVHCPLRFVTPVLCRGTGVNLAAPSPSIITFSFQEKRQVYSKKWKSKKQKRFK